MLTNPSIPHELYKPISHITVGSSPCLKCAKPGEGPSLTLLRDYKAKNFAKVRLKLY